MKIAFDCDDVLLDFIGTFARFYNEAYGTNLKRDDFNSYSFSKALGLNFQETRIKLGEFFENVARQLGNNKDLIQLASNYISNDLVKIIVFGSFVENELRLESDIDLSVEFDKIAKKEAGKFRIEISAKLPEKMDLQVFNVLPEKIKKEIEKKGRLIYKR